MKAEIIKKEVPEKFEPIVIELTIEDKSELGVLWNRIPPQDERDSSLASFDTLILKLWTN